MPQTRVLRTLRFSTRAGPAGPRSPTARTSQAFVRRHHFLRVSYESVTRAAYGRSVFKPAFALVAGVFALFLSAGGGGC